MNHAVFMLRLRTLFLLSILLGSVIPIGLSSADIPKPRPPAEPGRREEWTRPDLSRPPGPPHTLYLPTISTSFVSPYLLITQAQLHRMQQDVQANAPVWTTLLANVQSRMGTIDYYRSSPENIALVYLLTKDPQYAAAALRWARDTMTLNVRGGSYLEFGNYMRRVAIVLNYCGDAFTAAERHELATYLDRWTHELWFDNQGSGWGLADPGNNYHMAFLEGTAFAGYALKQAGYPNGTAYIDLVVHKLTMPDGVLAYLATRVGGGDWHEGTNYGQRSKQRLFNALAVIAAGGGPNFFTHDDFFANSILYAHYQLQPGNRWLYPGGDMALMSHMPVTPYDRDYLQTAVYWLPDSAARRYGQFFLENIMPDYDDSQRSFDSPPLYFKDMLYRQAIPSSPQSTLPLAYRAAGTDWINIRSGWDSEAVGLSVAGAGVIDQSHAHLDTGSFTLWKHGWQAADAVTLSSSGLLQGADAHNMIDVPGAQRPGVITTPGVTRYAHSPTLSYIQIDGSDLFRRRGDPNDSILLDEWTRELVYVAPNILIVYDRVQPTPGQTYSWRLHTPTQPTVVGNAYRAINGAGRIAVVPLGASTNHVRQDTDVAGGGSSTWRIEETVAATPGRFLNLIHVDDAAAPIPPAQRIDSTGGRVGAWTGGHAVLFSTAPFGQPSAGPFTYTLPTTATVAHTLLNMEGSYDVQVQRTATTTTVTVQQGTQLTANAEGMLMFTR